MNTSNVSGIATRFLLISDTHTTEFTPDTQPSTVETSGIDIEKELQSAVNIFYKISMLLLKLVIPGNHEFTLDIPFL